MNKLTIREILEKVDNINAFGTMLLREDKDLDFSDRENIAEMLSEYEDLLLRIKVKIWKESKDERCINN